MKVPTTPEDWRSWRRALFLLYVRKRTWCNSEYRLVVPQSSYRVHWPSGHVQTTCGPGSNLPGYVLSSRLFLLTNVVTTSFRHPQNLLSGSPKTRPAPLPQVLPLLCVSEGKGSSGRCLQHALQRSAGSASRPSSLLRTLLAVASDVLFQHVSCSGTELLGTNKM